MKYLRMGIMNKTTLALTVTALCSPAFGQEGPSRLGTFSFSQGFEYSDNVNLTDPSASGFTSRTGVGLSFQSETRTELLRFSIGTEVVGEFGSDLRDDFDFENTSIEGIYTRSSATASLRFTGSYVETELDDSIFALGDDGSIIIDEGSLARFSLGAGVVLGEGGPFEVSLDANYRTLNYQDTIDLTLSDEDQYSLNGLARFRLNPTTSLRAVAGITVTDEEDAQETERDVSFIGLGAETENAGGLFLFGDILFDRSETTTNAPSDETTDGIGVDFGVTQQRPNGAIELAFSSRIDEAGRRNSALVTRSLIMPTADLSVSVGVVDQDGDDQLQFIGGLDYTRELARGTVVASLNQDASSRDGVAFLNTELSLDYSHIINSISGWQAGLTYSSTEELGGADDDSRASAILSYTRDLTEEWNIRTGVEFIRDIESGEDNTTSNTVFFNIERDITFGF